MSNNQTKQTAKYDDDSVVNSNVITERIFGLPRPVFVILSGAIVLSLLITILQFYVSTISYCKKPITEKDSNELI